jgi:O-antigen ligase
LFLLISLAFTYSRASYVAFIGVAAWISYKEKLIKKMMFVVLGLIVLVLLLPTARNHSIELTRTFSIFDRLDNYKETVQIVEKFPVFGVGFDNLCLAKNKFISIESFSSHSCSGSDSSLLFMLATTGIVGFLIFIGAALNIFSLLSKSLETKIFTGSMISLLIHSLFSNSMFYPWIMGYVFILLVLALKE